MREAKFTVLSSLVNANQEYSVPAFFTLFQDLAMLNSDDIGIGVDKVLNKGKLWVYTRVLAEFNEMPKYTSEAKLMTYPHKVRAGFMFHRQAVLSSPNGKIYARISSIWAIIDANTRKLDMRPGLPIIEEEYPNPLEDPGKVNPQEASYLYSKIVRYSDCDLNKHFNNVRYIELIIDTNPLEFYKRKMISRLLINYNHEIHDGEKVDIYVNDDNTYVEGKVGDISCFVAEVSYKDREEQ